MVVSSFVLKAKIMDLIGFSMRKYQLTTIFFLFVLILSAQTDLKIYQWKSHLPYDVGKSITQSDSKVYFAGPYAVFSVNKQDNDGMTALMHAVKYKNSVKLL